MPRYKAYVVTVGTKTGVFAQWLDVKAVTDGVPGASYQGFKDWGEALAAFNKARREGKTKIVKIGPPEEESPSAARTARTASVNASGRYTQDDRREARQDQDRRHERGELQQQSTSPRANAVSRSGSTQSAEARAARDAAIADELEQVRRERQQQASSRGGQLAGRGGLFTSSIATYQNRESTSARTLQPSPSHASTPPRATITRRATEPALDSDGRSEPSTSSSPPTGVTVLERGSSASALSPRSLQSTSSFSYWSDEPESPGGPAQAQSRGARSPAPSISSEVTGSTFLSSADVRSDLSSPSSCGTRYFPEDYLSRVRAKRERASARSPVRSPASVVSEVPVTPMADEPSMLFAPHEPMQSFASTRPAATSGPQVHVYPVSTSSAVRPNKPSIKTYDDAGVQNDRHTAPSNRADANVQTIEQRRYVSTRTQTSPMLAPEAARPGERCGCERPEWVCRCCGLPSSPPPRGVMYAVANRRTPTSTRSSSPASSQACAMSRPWSPVLSPLTRSPVMFSPTFYPQGLSPSPNVIASSPRSRLESAIGRAESAAASSPASRSSGRSRSSLRSRTTSYYTASPGAGEAVTPPLGLSERHTESMMSMASVREGVEVIARGAVPTRGPGGRASTVASSRTPRRASGGARVGSGGVTSPPTRSPPVLHDTTFDPRSPIQRGTLIPLGCVLFFCLSWLFHVNHHRG
ncbi:hypothetical protein GY45DRAFT_1322904 [Cubamyces sp. BRFM 1775]|nr:hypothetical protein GY45DRAFT_1322904 [Cubamyces sp. BRFM 1775]